MTRKVDLNSKLTHEFYKSLICATLIACLELNNSTMTKLSFSWLLVQVHVRLIIWDRKDLRLNLLDSGVMITLFILGIQNKRRKMKVISLAILETTMVRLNSQMVLKIFQLVFKAVMMNTSFYEGLKKKKLTFMKALWLHSLKKIIDTNGNLMQRVKS